MTTPEYEPPAGNPHDDPAAPLDYPASYAGPPGHPGLPPPVYPAPYPWPVGYPPPGQFAGPYDPYRPVVPTGTNGKAIGALVAAVIGIPACACFVPSLVGIVLGVIAMGETKRSGQPGRGLALAAVVVGVATLMLGILFAVFTFVAGTAGS